MGRAGLTVELARFIAAAPLYPRAPELLLAAKRAFIDTIGVIIAGRREAGVSRVATCCADGGDSFAIAAGRRLAARDAALIDGVAGHVLDYDDVALHGHASVVLIPAIMAEAQRLGATGADALQAYAIGYEVWTELGLREPDTYHAGSWHPTSMLGAIAATAAVAALNRLDEARAQHALSIAASLASGIIGNFGTQAKALNAGRAAANAIDAVCMARAGLEGAKDALEGPHGFLRGLSPHGRVDTTAPPRYPEEGWQLLRRGNSVKCYPVCYATHRAVDGVIALAADAGIKAADVTSVTVALGPAPAQIVANPHPLTGLEAKFSLSHNVAAALLDHNLGFAQLADSYVRRAELVALYPLVRMELRDEPCAEQPGLARFDRVVIETRGQQSFDSGDIRYPRGHAKLPLSETELDAKFLDCARHGETWEPQELLERLHGLDRAPEFGKVLNP